VIPGASAVIRGNLAAATHDGTASCDSGGAASRDVWYSISGGATGGILTLSTCGTTGVPDTVVSLYTNCGGIELGCSDDCGGVPCAGPASCISGLAIGAQQNLLVRVSDRGFASCGEFNLNFNLAMNPPANDNCNTPIVLPGQGVYAFDTTLATTGTEGQGSTTFCGSLTPVRKDLWYTYTAGVTGTVTISTCGLIPSGFDDTKITLYQGAGCPSLPTGVACDDNACVVPDLASNLIHAATCGEVFTIQIGNFSPLAAVNIVGSFSVVENGTSCITPTATFCSGETVGSTCTNCGNNGGPGRGCANSNFGAGGRLASILTASLSADTLVLTASEITGPGLFFQATGVYATPFMFGDGMLCAGIGIVRLGVVFPVGGAAAYPGGSTPNPISIGGAPILAGDVRHYQCWYRDAVPFCTSATFNMTNGVSLTWLP
jgi:hypothetical protein